MATYSIRQYGDPVLRQRARDVVDIDSRIHSLVADMIETMYDAPGVGLAAPQVGVHKRLFVYDLGDGDGAQCLLNASIVEEGGEWAFEEGCLSVPGLSWEIVRPKDIHVTGIDLDGNEVSIEATEYHARVFQHEVDHLDGVLLVDRLDPQQRRQALKVLRERDLASSLDPDGLSALVSPSGDAPVRPLGLAISGGPGTARGNKPGSGLPDQL